MNASLKRAVWDMYVGPGVKETLCLLCGIHQINSNLNSGFEAAHVIARKWFANEKLSVFYLMPSCKSCNNECGDLCILDYLFVCSRIAALRRVIMTIYNAFLTLHIHELAPAERMAWRVMEHLYGPSRFPINGSIVNTKAIYEIARVEQHAALVQEAAQLAAQQQALSIQMRALMEADIRPMKFGH